MPNPALAALLVTSLLPQDPAAPSGLRETVLGRVDATTTVFIEPNGRGAAMLGRQGSRTVVLVDGEPGPVVDGIAGQGVAAYERAAQVAHNPMLPMQLQHPRRAHAGFLFSNDGTRVAYVARIGRDHAMFLDGKELSRHSSASGACAIQDEYYFSPGGRHLVYRVVNEAEARTYVDGKPLEHEPESERLPVWSPDEAHFLYFSKARDGSRFLVIDGQRAAYPATFATFTANSRMVLALSPEGATAPNKLRLLANRKPVMDLEHAVEVFVSPNGSPVIVPVQRGAGPKRHWLLTAGGKDVAASVCKPDERLLPVTFSPDGKRYATAIQSSFGMRVLVDGRADAEYRSVRDFRWSADSAHYSYIASTDRGGFLVVDGNECPQAWSGLPGVAFAGARVAYWGLETDSPTHWTQVIDRQVRKIDRRGGSRADVLLSQDGSRFACYRGNLQWEISGMDAGGVQTDAAPVMSPDGRHVARFGLVAATQQRGLFVGESRLPVPMDRNASVVWMQFSPDSRHLYWIGTCPTDVRLNSLFCNATRLADFAREVPAWPSGSYPVVVGDAGVSLIAVRDGNLVRLQATPDPASDLAALLGASMAAPK